MKTCLNCGEPMNTRSVTQLYCSHKCQQEYYRAHKREAVAARWPSVTFTCAKCGREVTTAPGTADRRTRFCSAECEKKYYRHPPWEVRRTSVWVDRPPRQPKVFVCAECGKRVVTDPDEGDLRWRFCCKEHRRRFWHRQENVNLFPSVQRRRAHLFEPVICACCGKKFIPAIEHRRKYCSAECAGKGASVCR